jgi:hypothetical protein
MSGTVIHYKVDGRWNATLDWDFQKVECRGCRLDFATSRAFFYMRKYQVREMTVRGRTLTYVRTSKKAAAVIGAPYDETNESGVEQATPSTGDNHEPK